MATNEMQLEAASLPVHVPTDDEIAAIRKRGALVVAHNREVGRIRNMLAGTEWGAKASEHTLAVVAEFCKVVGAHPVYHVDVLGGRAFLNANYWSDRINKDERFVDFEQRNISDDADARKHYAAPEWATYVYETTIRKLAAFAPIDKIKSGEITDWRNWVVETREANWAGNKPKGKKSGGVEYDADPVGNAEPAKTARTRSLRRCAARAFAAWMVQYEEQIKKAEDALEAEWEEIKPRRNVAPAGRQALSSGNGEPTGAPAEAAQSLPVEDRTAGQQAERSQPQQDAPAAAPNQPQSTNSNATDFDEDRARRGYMASLREIGIDKPEGRKQWQVANGLPESVTTWTREHFERAMTIIVAVLRKRADEGARVLGHTDAAALCQAWGAVVETPKDLADLISQINAKIDEREAGQPQRQML